MTDKPTIDDLMTAAGFSMTYRTITVVEDIEHVDMTLAEWVVHLVDDFERSAVVNASSIAHGFGTTSENLVGLANRKKRLLGVLSELVRLASEA